MRIFNTITSWLLWIVCVLYWLELLFIRVVNVIPRHVFNPDNAAKFTELYWAALALMTVVSAVVYLIRRRLWYVSQRAPGFGFWLVTVVLSLCVLFVSVSGFTPYFGVGDRSALQWTSLTVGAFFII